MFEKDILGSLKSMVLDRARGERKLSEVIVLNYSPKRSRDVVAPSYDDAVGTGPPLSESGSGPPGRQLPADLLRSTNINSKPESETTFKKSNTATGQAPPLTQLKEVRTEVTPDLLKKILKSTAKTKQIDPTLELALHGSLYSDATESAAARGCVTSTKIRQLKSSCPSMKTLLLQNLNLHAKQKSRRVRLIDFPANIERVSLRGSLFSPKSFFAKMEQAAVSRLKVLDVGRAIFVESGSTGGPERYWPPLASLEELYMEGAPHLDSNHFLTALLTNFPKLRVLDVEGTAVGDLGLATIARLAPNLRELYLGYTALRDAAIVSLENAGVRMPHLESVCLCETAVTELGLASLARICPSLRSVTVRRSKVSEAGVFAAQRTRPALHVRRVENTHIYAVFRNQGCEHFNVKHCLNGVALP